MKSEAEKKFNALVKSMIEDTDFEEDLNARLREAGLDKAPDFAFLHEGKKPCNHAIASIRDSRALKIALFIIAVFVVSGAMTLFINSNFASAAKFHLDNFMFDIRNGIFASDIQFNTTELGKELLIENEGQISIGKDYLKELRTPGFIPDGFRFVSLRITNNPQNEYIAIFKYENTNGEFLIIDQEKLVDYNGNADLFGVEDEFYIGGARVLYIPDAITAYNSIHAFTNFETVFISGPVDRSELTRIFEMFD